MNDLSAALARQEQRSETSANEYDADEANLASINGNISTLDANIANLKVKEAKKRASVQRHPERGGHCGGARLRARSLPVAGHLAVQPKRQRE